MKFFSSSRFTLPDGDSYSHESPARINSGMASHSGMRSSVLYFMKDSPCVSASDRERPNT